MQHNVPATARCWLSGMRRLRKLSFTIEDDGLWDVGQLCFDPPPRALAGLENLTLAARRVDVTPRAHLPPSLTRVYMLGFTGAALPPQVLGSAEVLHAKPAMLS